MARGGARKGAGRPEGIKTGRTTATLAFRVPIDIADRIHANAEAADLSVSAYLEPIFRNQFKPRKSRSPKQPKKGE